LKELDKYPFLGDSDFVEKVLKNAHESLEKKYGLKIGGMISIKLVNDLADNYIIFGKC